MAFCMAGGGPLKPEINVTPLIDVLLVLIIIFMVVVTLNPDKGLKAEIPEQAQAPEHAIRPERTIVIQLVESAQNQPPALKVNQEDVPWEMLKQRLQEIFKTRAERVAFVQGDEDIDFQYVADVIDIARDAGVERVGLLGNSSDRTCDGSVACP